MSSPEKMTVEQLRTELSKHGISTKGRKAELISRYINFLEMMKNVKETDEGGEDEQQDNGGEGTDEADVIEQTAEDDGNLPKAEDSSGDADNCKETAAHEQESTDPTGDDHATMDEKLPQQHEEIQHGGEPQVAADSIHHDVKKMDDSVLPAEEENDSAEVEVMHTEKETYNTKVTDESELMEQDEPEQTKQSTKGMEEQDKAPSEEQNMDTEVSQETGNIIDEELLLIDEEAPEDIKSTMETEVTSDSAETKEEKGMLDTANDDNKEKLIELVSDEQKADEAEPPVTCKKEEKAQDKILDGQNVDELQENTSKSLQEKEKKVTNVDKNKKISPKLEKDESKIPADKKKETMKTKKLTVDVKSEKKAATPKPKSTEKVQKGTAAPKPSQDKPFTEHMRPELCSKKLLIDDIKWIKSGLQIYVYPVTLANLSENKDILECLKNSSSYSFHCFPPQAGQKDGDGVLDITMKSISDFKDAKKMFSSMQPDSKVATFEDLTLELRENPQSCLKGAGLARALFNLVGVPYGEIPAKLIVCIFGVPKTATEKSILDLYPGRYAYVKRNQEGVPTGDAFVEFKEEKDLKAVLQQEPKVLDSIRLTAFCLTDVIEKGGKLLTDADRTNKIKEVLLFREKMAKEWFTTPLRELYKRIKIIADNEQILIDDQFLRTKLKSVDRQDNWHAKLQSLRRNTEIGGYSKGLVYNNVQNLKLKFDLMAKKKGENPEDYPDIKVIKHRLSQDSITSDSRPAAEKNIESPRERKRPGSTDKQPLAKKSRVEETAAGSPDPFVKQINAVAKQRQAAIRVAQKIERERAATTARLRAEQARARAVTAEALRKRALEERQREAAEEAARNRAAAEAAQRRRAMEEAAARERALEEAHRQRQRAAAEEAARNRAAMEAAQRRRALEEAAARERAVREQATRRAEMEKLERERVERERIERERAEIERIERERAERARAERERIEREFAERERRARERADLERSRMRRELPSTSSLQSSNRDVDDITRKSLDAVSLLVNLSQIISKKSSLSAERRQQGEREPERRPLYDRAEHQPEIGQPGVRPLMEAPFSSNREPSYAGSNEAYHPAPEHPGRKQYPDRNRRYWQ